MGWLTFCLNLAIMCLGIATTSLLNTKPFVSTIIGFFYGVVFCLTDALITKHIQGTGRPILIRKSCANCKFLWKPCKGCTARFENWKMNKDKYYAGVAQQAEQRYCKPTVEGSIPFTSSTIFLEE